MASVRAQTPPAAPAFSFERVHTRVRFENDGSGRREQTLWIRVLDEQAVRQFGEFPMLYQSESEDLTVSDVAVQKPDGSLVPTPASSVQDLSAVAAGQMPIYVDVRQKVTSIAALRPGDVLRITGVWTIKKPVAPGQFWFEHSFDSTDRVLDEQLEIDVPADRAIALKTRAEAPAEEHGGSGTVSGGRRVYRWKTSHPQADSKPPLRQPGEDEPPADVRVSSFRTWDEVARWFTPLTFVPADAAVKAKAEALTSGAAGDAAKIAAIYRFVSTEIRYVSLSFGLGRFAAHAPSDVLKTQYGDCKDKAVLLRAMLDVVGVRAVPVLINTTRSIAEDFASPLEFDHMIAVAAPAPRLDGTWMDATIEVAPLGMLGAATRDRRALALPGDAHGVLVRTPADPPVPSTSAIVIDGAINPLGVLAAKVTVTERGDGEIEARSLVRAMPRTLLKEYVERIAAANGISGEIADPATSDPADTREPFRITFAVRAAGFLDWAAARSHMSVPVREKLPYPTEEARKDLHRLQFVSPITSHVRATITLPAGYEAAVPQPVRVSRAGLTYSSAYTAEGARLTIDRELRVPERQVPESSFGEYAALVAAMEADAAQGFTVRTATATIPAIPADVTGDELYKAGRSAWDAKRYAAAAAIYQRATEVAPKMGDAWIALGLAYEKLGKPDEAAAAIQKQIDLDPYNKRAYGDLGFVLKNAGKKEEAIKAYARHTELNALDGEALKQLGILRVGTGHPAEALPALEKAAGLLPRDAWVEANLVRAYLETTQPEKARPVLDALLDQKPNAELREYVGWQMANHGFDLGRAEELSRSAEQDFVAELRGADLATVTDTTFDHVERLAWTWDALGWIAFQRGNPAQAEPYVRAAWQLAGAPDIAFHLGQILEKRDKPADALSYYLTAQALDSHAPAEVTARVKKLAGDRDPGKLLVSALRTVGLERSIDLGMATPGQAQFFAIVDNTRKAVDVRFVSGPDPLKAIGDKLRSATLPLAVPTDSAVKIPVSVAVNCVSPGQCRGVFEYPARVRVPRAPAGSMP